MIRRILLLCCLVATTHLFAQDYKLVWEDNFNNDQLDDGKWTILINGKGGGNKELQYYRKQNISIGSEPASGERCLIITARKEKFRGKKATSGRLSTKNKMDFRYGKVEARIKLPHTADGLWPAFWMLGSDHPETRWPKCGEIDILEMGHADGIKSGTQDRLFNGACHWGEAFNGGKYPNYAKASVNSYSLQDDFHLFTLIWDKKVIRMYVDADKYPEREPYFEMPIDSEVVPNKPASYFNKPFVLIFNLAVGGNFPSIRDVNKITALAKGEAKMYVDYVRVYQKGDENEQIQIYKK